MSLARFCPGSSEMGNCTVFSCQSSLQTLGLPGTAGRSAVSSHWDCTSAFYMLYFLLQPCGTNRKSRINIYLAGICITCSLGLKINIVLTIITANYCYSFFAACLFAGECILAQSLDNRGRSAESICTVDTVILDCERGLVFFDHLRRRHLEIIGGSLGQNATRFFNYLKMWPNANEGREKFC